MSDQWLTNSQITERETASSQQASLLRDFDDFIRSIVPYILAIVFVWTLIAFVAWPLKHHKPSWDGQYNFQYYSLNDFLSSGGLDLSKSFLLGFGPASNLEGQKPSFNLIGASGKAVRLSLQWHGNGYVMDLPLDSVAIRLDATNTIHVHVTPDYAVEPTGYFVATRHSMTVSNFFLFHHWIKREQHVPITSTETWKVVHRNGAGEFLWKHSDLIDSVAITLTPQDYQKYAARLPLSG